MVSCFLFPCIMGQLDLPLIFSLLMNIWPSILENTALMTAQWDFAFMADTADLFSTSSFLLIRTVRESLAVMIWVWYFCIFVTAPKTSSMCWQGAAQPARAGRREQTMHMELHGQPVYALTPAASEHGRNCCCLNYCADMSVVALMNSDGPDSARY